jgi:2-keto-4-pentenoate hydratase/2-oxohepta-3-ene-1,7-dioic acid hydratase in catechol pathway
MRSASALLALALASCARNHTWVERPVSGQKWVRFHDGNAPAYGLVEGNRVRRVRGHMMAPYQVTDQTYALSEIRILTPIHPSKVLALAGSYKSHLGTTPPSPHPEVFFKLPSCLVPQGADVVIPKGTNDVHFEAELVLVIGKRAKDVPVERAKEHIFGVTCGNDISARDWQKADRQWWRAKGSDTFGPVGPWIVTGLNYDDLEVQMRVNGEVKQKERTSALIHNCAAIVSFLSRHVTLEPGDLIYTGTSGQTSAIKPGDVMEVEIEGIGILRNRVAAAP